MPPFGTASRWSGHERGGHRDSWRPLARAAVAVLGSGWLCSGGSTPDPRAGLSDWSQHGAPASPRSPAGAAAGDSVAPLSRAAGAAALSIRQASLTDISSLTCAVFVSSWGFCALLAARLGWAALCCVLLVVDGCAHRRCACIRIGRASHSSASIVRDGLGTLGVQSLPDRVALSQWRPGRSHQLRAAISAFSRVWDQEDKAAAFVDWLPLSGCGGGAGRPRAWRRLNDCWVGGITLRLAVTRPTTRLVLPPGRSGATRAGGHGAIRGSG